MELHIFLGVFTVPVKRQNCSTMSPWLISFVSFCYAWTGIEQWTDGKYWFGVMWICYAIANMALFKAGAV